MLFRSKSLFTRILSAYLLILAIPFMTTLLIIGYTSNMFRSEVQKNTDVVLKNISLSLDGRFNEINQIAKNIMKDQRFTLCQLKDPDNLNDVYSFVELANYLSIYNSPYYDDLFVYFHTADKLVSGRYATAPSGTYYQANYQNATESYEDWRKPLTTIASGTYVKTFTSANLPTVMYLASFPQSYNMFEKNISSTVGIVISAATLKQLLYQNGTQNYHSEIVICDRYNHILIATNDKFDTIDIEKSLQMEGYHTVQVGGERYVEQSYRSSSTGCSYLLYTPTGYYWQKVNNLQIILIALFILFMILSAFISMWLARYTYSPVKNLVTAIRQKTQLEQEKKIDEIAYIQTALDAALEEKQRLAVKLNTRAVELVDAIFYKALLGILPEDFDVAHVLKNYNIHIQNGVFAVVLFQIASSGQETAYPADEAIRALIESEYYRVSDPSIRYFATKTDHDKYAVVVNNADAADLDAKIMEYTLTVKDSLALQTAPDSAVSISRPHRSVRDLHKAYAEVLKALDYKIVYGTENIIRFDEIKYKVFNYKYEALLHINNQIEAFIISDKGTLTAKEFYSALQKKCFDEKNASLEVFTCFRYDLINSLAKIVSELFTPKYVNDNKVIDCLLEAGSFGSFQQLFIETLTGLQKGYQAAKSSCELTQKIKGYIQLHYANPNLSINALGDDFDLSPSYLSRQFKTQTGISPLEYISTIRIQKSKELLVSTEKGIEQIASECGYLSSSVFIRSFKKAEGITPGEYKKITQSIGEYKKQV